MGEDLCVSTYHCIALPKSLAMTDLYDMPDQQLRSIVDYQLIPGLQQFTTR